MSETLASNGVVTTTAAAPAFASRAVALGYYDGPTNGILECGGPGGALYKFDLLELVPAEDGDDLRVFTLAPLPSASLTEFVGLLATYQPAQWPLWCPLWSFPSQEVKRTMDQGTDEILRKAGPVEWVIAVTQIPGSVLSARRVTQQKIAAGTDWLSTLGLSKRAPWLATAVNAP